MPDYSKLPKALGALSRLFKEATVSEDTSAIQKALRGPTDLSTASLPAVAIPAKEPELPPLQTPVADLVNKVMGAPTRRTILKQAAASVLRNAVPGMVDSLISVSPALSQANTAAKVADVIAPTASPWSAYLPTLAAKYAELTGKPATAATLARRIPELDPWPTKQLYDAVGGDWMHYFGKDNGIAWNGPQGYADQLRDFTSKNPDSEHASKVSAALSVLNKQLNSHNYKMRIFDAAHESVANKLGVDPNVLSSEQVRSLLHAGRNPHIPGSEGLVGLGSEDDLYSAFKDSGKDIVGRSPEEFTHNWAKEIAPSLPEGAGVDIMRSVNPNFDKRAAKLHKELWESRKDWGEPGTEPTDVEHYAEGGWVHPTDAQVEAGNYPKGHVYAHGMRISIENPAGSIREGTGKDGEAWSSRLQHDYGYVRGSTGRDGDHVDVFLGPDPKNRELPVYVVDQHDPDTGRFDEHKAMLGFPTQKEAVAAYHANYHADWRGAQAVTPLHVDEFKRWATSPGARVKPLANHVGVRRYAEGGSVGGFLSDPQSWADMARNSVSLANRFATQMAGGLADMGQLPAVALRGLNNVGRAAVGAAPQAELAEPALGSRHLQDLAREHGISTSTGDEGADALFDVASLAAALSPAKTARLAGAPLRGAASVLKAVAEGELGPRAGGRAAQTGVIKAPGGNWDAGNVEAELKRLKNAPILSGEILDEAAGKPLFNEYALSGKDEGLHAWAQKNHPDVYNKLLTPQDAASNAWIDKQLTRYVKNDMATERDPVRALAEQGVLHVPQQDLHTYAATRELRKLEGYPKEGVAQSDLARGWEGAADDSLHMNTLGELRHPTNRSAAITKRMLEQNPWTNKMPDEAKMYGMDDMSATDLNSKLGFNHLVDELRNATNPASGLPRELQLKPESLRNVSMPQAVELVSKINKWRADQKVAANASLANNPATFVHKEYPDTGFKWVELKKPESIEGWAQDSKGQWRGPKGEFTATDPSEVHLGQALKYEGDTMGHCVGGYCDDVANGSSRIFSLRDAKGQPHVTIETKPSGPKADPRFDAGIDFDEQAHADVRRAFPRMDEESDDYMMAVNERATDLANDWNKKQKIGQPDNISQIKGKGNKGVADKYRPIVEDFLNSFPHGDAQDLQLNGIHDVTMGNRNNTLSRIAQPGDAAPSDADVILRKHSKATGQRYMSTESIRQLLGLDSTQVPKKYADGGVVTGPWWDSYVSGTGDAIKAAAAPQMTLDQFKATVTPNMLGADGTFKAPSAGVNYMLEGLTPEQAYATVQPQNRPEIDGGGNTYQTDPGFQREFLNPAWRAGPDNGGGMLGGVTRAVGNLGTGIAHNPALMAALTAGVINPAVNSGLQQLGVAANTAKTLTPLVTSAGKTILGGGSVADAAKNAGASYLGGQAGDAAAGTLDLPDLAPAVKYLVGNTTSSALKGKRPAVDPFGFAASLAAPPVPRTQGALSDTEQT